MIEVAVGDTSVSTGIEARAGWIGIFRSFLDYLIPALGFSIDFLCDDRHLAQELFVHG